MDIADQVQFFFYYLQIKMPKRKLGSNDSAEDLPQKRKSYAKNDINSSSSSQESFSICDNAAKV